MKIKVTQEPKLTPFKALSNGEVWMTRQASLEFVNTLHVKISANEYVELGGGTIFTIGTDESMVRRVRIDEIKLTLI